MARPIKCLMSAGPTREFFDPVRFLSNPSSGKMGYALAEAAASQGWDVTLVSGPVSLNVPAGVECLSVVTGEDMYEALASRFEDADLLIMSAAVMDYRPKEASEQKVKKDQLSMTVEMEATRDILKTLGKAKKGQLMVGFAAETENVEAYARGKLIDKCCDYVAANQVGGVEGGFQSDTNTIILVGHDGFKKIIGPASKTAIARDLISFLSERL